MKVIRILILTVWMITKEIQGLKDKIPNPCPVSRNSPVADMCSSVTTTENGANGFEYLDSVILRAMVNQAGCSCDLSIDNQIAYTQIFMEKYDKLLASAPEDSSCGLAIDIENLNDGSMLDPIQCGGGVNRRSYSIVNNGVFKFTSRAMNGDFTRGYCIHIIRGLLDGHDPQRLKIVCKESGLSGYDSSSMNPTETWRNESAILDFVSPSITPSQIKSHTNDDNTLLIIVGTCTGILSIIVIAIISFIIRRRLNKRKEESQTNASPDSNTTEQDYDGMKYNALYVSADQHVDTDINYSTVDLKRSPIHSVIENPYNIDESNAKHSSVKTIFDSKTNIKNETLKSSNEIKNLSPSNECNVVYAVVDKRLKNQMKNATTKIQDDANPEQAYAVVDKTRKHDL